MVDLYKAYGTDPSLEEEGVWRKLASGIEVKIARMGNDAFQRAYNQLPAEIRQGFEDDTEGSLEEETARDYLADLVAKTILRDWKNVTIEGEEKPYTPELGYELLRDESLKDFLGEILQLSRNRKLFRERQQEANLGNSKRGSGGGSKSGQRGKR